ncbi:MAG: translocation/assembly module TamB domain-containing protein [Candidatus Omnitrophota bacterium]
MLIPVFIIGLLCFLLFTSTGAGLITKIFAARFIALSDFEFKNLKGNFLEKVTYEQVKLKDLKWLPLGSVLDIEKIDLYLSAFFHQGIEVKFLNATVTLPNSETILLNGTCHGGIFDVDIESKQIGFREILAILPGDEILKKISGDAAELKIRLTGTIDAPKINGTFRIEDVTYDKFLLQGSIVTVGIVLKRLGGNLKAEGQVMFKNPVIVLAMRQKSMLKMQHAEFSIIEGNISNIQITNGTLILPDANRIWYYGSYDKEVLDMTVYAKDTDVRSILDLFPDNTVLGHISGIINDVDIHVKGRLWEPDFSGSFLIEDVSYKRFSIVNCPVMVTLTFKDIKDKVELHGNVFFNRGMISGQQSAVIKLDKSKLLFSGDLTKPVLDIKGSSAVERTKINIVLKGSIDKPDLNLTSQPLQSQERLLVMLVTGKKWKGIEASYSQGNIAPDLAADFIDYFIFGGMGNKIAQRFGLSDISIKYDHKTKGIGATTDLSDKATATYSIEQPRSTEEKPTTTHKVSAEYAINESISVGAETEIKQTSQTKETQDKQRADGNVMLKLKKKF